MQAFSRGPHSGLPGGFAFEEATDSIQFSDLAEIEGSDESALSGVDFDETFTFKAKDSFADRSAAELEGMDVLVGGDGVTGGERIGKDLAFEFGVRKIGGGQGRGRDGSLFF